jgi:sugar lactone lactonase YvrE
MLGKAGLAFAALACLAPASAMAAPGDVYVADLGGGGDGRVLRIGPGGGDATLVASAGGGFNPSTLAFTRSGTFLASDKGLSARVWEIDPRTAGITTFLGSPTTGDPQDAIVAPDGTVFVSDRIAGPGGTPAVLRVDPVTKAVSTLASGAAFGTNVRALAATRAGTVFATGGDAVFRITPTGAVSELVPPDPAFSGANGIAITPDESALFVAAFDSTPNQILRVDTSTGAFTPYATFPDVMDVALLPDGSLLATDDSAGKVYRVAPTGGTPTVFSEDPDLTGGELGGLAVEPEPCGGKLPTVVGTTGNDALNGTETADVISTLGGNDVINGLGGDDVVCGSDGNDRLMGGAGRDTLIGAKGKDRLNGQAGKDRLVGGKGKDRLNGGKGKDVCKSGPGRDRESSC